MKKGLTSGKICGIIITELRGNPPLGYGVMVNTKDFESLVISSILITPAMQVWWNGRHVALRMLCFMRVGSSPTTCTIATER